MFDDNPVSVNTAVGFATSATNDPADALAGATDPTARRIITPVNDDASGFTHANTTDESPAVADTPVTDPGGAVLVRNQPDTSASN